MNRIFAVLLILLLSPLGLAAQFNIKQQTEANSIEVAPPVDKRITKPSVTDKITYSTNALIDAERRRLRKERNTLEITADLTASRVYFNNWANGGNENTNVRGFFYTLYKYQRDRFTITNKFNTRLGFNIVDTAFFKNEDFFDFNSLSEWKINEKWSYSGLIIFRSQYMKGYKSMNNNTLVSDFMSPGTLELGPGFTYTPFGPPLKITISPISGKILFVLNDELSAKGINRIEKGRHVQPMIGPSLAVSFNKRYFSNKLEIRSDLNAFYNFNLAPTARWENIISYRPVKFLVAKFYYLAIYDKEVVTPDMYQVLQSNYSITFGLSYTFKNK